MQGGGGTFSIEVLRVIGELLLLKYNTVKRLECEHISHKPAVKN